MRAYDVIAKKRDRQTLTDEEIRYLIRGFVEGRIPDYQVSAWLMAVYLNGLSDSETSSLTSAMVDSGEAIDLSEIPGVKVDKHSTGGVGDKTTLVVVPLLAAAGLKIAKMSGRGLGHTGGTLDKLQSIPGMRIDLSVDELIEEVKAIGAAIIGQTAELVPADKRLYALRDVTATVESIPLIASSIMSKKIAAGADTILLDVKVGSGAFMKTLERARELSRAMVRMGELAGRRVVCVITDMDQPLGRAVGNALEVAEAVDTLRGRGPEDLERLCIALCAVLTHASGAAVSVEAASEQVRSLLRSGAGLRKLAEIIRAQSGDERVTEDPSLLPQADRVIAVESSAGGYVAEVDAMEIGLAAMAAGAGRLTKGDTIDPAVGVVLAKKQGERIEKGESLAFIHCSMKVDPAHSKKLITKAYTISDKQPAPSAGVFEIIGFED